MSVLAWPAVYLLLVELATLRNFWEERRMLTGRTSFLFSPFRSPDSECAPDLSHLLMRIGSSLHQPSATSQAECPSPALSCTLAGLHRLMTVVSFLSSSGMLGFGEGLARIPSTLASACNVLPPTFFPALFYTQRSDSQRCILFVCLFPVKYT